MAVFSQKKGTAMRPPLPINRRNASEQTPAAHPHLTSESNGGASMATKKWSAKVDTDSTHPDQGLFNKSASAMAKALASKKVSPKGPASGMRMLNFYINRAGKNLSASRKAELRKAKTHLSEIIAKQKSESPAKAAKKTTKKAAKKSLSKTSRKAASKKTSTK
jgi:tRNA(adenine34) deaminase